jgi:DNA repair exonuclease SbcCD ATPase subunit
MRVTRFLLQDFGRHKLIDKKIDVPVLGLVGPNGFGKTTILAAFVLAFTGNIPGKAETYVRNAFVPRPPEGSKDPDLPDNGRVTLWIRKDNKEGELMRQVGKTPKRHFIWDGVKYTSASDISAKLKELFDADKDAIANAVFPPQGSLDKLLFGTASERIELFTKFLLIGYTSKIVDAADKEIALLLNQVQDYTTLLTEVKTQHAAAENNLATLEGNKARSHNWSVSLGSYRDYVNEQSKGLDLVRDAQQVTSDIRALRNSLDGELIRISKLAAVSDASLAGVTTYVNAIEQSIVELTNRINDQARIIRLKTQKEDAQEKLKLVQDKLVVSKALVESNKDHATEIEDLEKRIKNGEERIRLLLEVEKSILPALQDAAQSFHEWLDADAQSSSKFDYTLLEEEAKTNQRKAIVAESKIEVLERMVASGDDGAICALCGTHAQGDFHRWADKLTVAKAEAAPLRARADESEKAWIAAKENSEVHARRKNEITNRISAAKQDLDVYNAAIAAIEETDVEVLRDRISVLRTEQYAYRSAVDSVTNLSREQSTLSNILTTISPSDMLSIIDFDPQEYVVLEKELSDCVQTLEAINAPYQGLRPIEILKDQQAKIELLEGRQKTIRSDMAQNQISVNNKYALLSSQTIQVITAHGNSTGEALRELQEKDQEYVELAGQVKQAQVQADALQKRRNDIEEQIDKDKLRQKVIDELKTLKAAFHKNAIPQAYMQYVFENLTPIAQDNLNTLGADFIITPDEEEPVTVKFMKLNEDKSGWMPQSKLSGGEKVRVSIAYLLAIQQLIIPDIAFLVLDEPSTHIDDAGIDSMKELFVQLGQQLQHTEAQIIVCDHKTELQVAFQETIKLG